MRSSSAGIEVRSGRRAGRVLGCVLLFLLSSSPALGQTFGPPTPLNTNAGGDSGGDVLPQLSTDGAGNWIAVWSSDDSLGGTIGSDHDILFARSTDAGATWSAPSALNTNAYSDSGSDFEPQLTTDGAGTWIAVWSSNDSLGGTIGTDSDILVARSTDGGVSWSAPTSLKVNANTDDPAYDQGPQLTTDGAGSWIAVWESSDSLGGTIGNDWDILFARSTDGGVSWSAPAALNSNASIDISLTSVVNDFQPQLTTDGAGTWIAVWNMQVSSFGTYYFTSFARSTDGGVTWSAQVAINQPPAPLGAGAPQLTTDGTGTWIAVWPRHDAFADYDIWFARSTDAGVTWNTPATLNTNAASDPQENDYSPQLTTDGAGTWIAVWYSNNPTYADYDILFARSTDTGATWTDPALLNGNAGTGSTDANPQLTTDGAGTWIAVWDSNDSLGGTIGSDGDTLFARATYTPQVSGFLIPPLTGYTPTTIPINAVFDHSIGSQELFGIWTGGPTDGPGTEYHHPSGGHDRDGAVVAFTGERADHDIGHLLGCYTNGPPGTETSFLQGWNYSQNDLDPPQLCYDGHSGIDFGAALMSSVKAAAGGEIIFRGCACGFTNGLCPTIPPEITCTESLGNYIAIRHPNGYITYYGHLADFGVYDVGDSVGAGYLIGYSGDSGSAQGSPHLHFEVTFNELISVDPYGLNGVGNLWLTAAVVPLMSRQGHGVLIMGFLLMSALALRRRARENRE